jgi:hypothetical protein
VGDLALFDRGIDQCLAGRIIEIDRDLAPEGDRQVGNSGGYGRGNHQTEVDGRAPESLENAAEDECPKKRLAVCEASPGAVGEGGA